jgi:hypothetical protein
MTSIAIIDSGINIEHKEFKNKNIKGFNIDTYENSIDSVKDYSGHGTACAAEILRINPDTNINVIKTLNENSQASVRKLIESIEYASEIDDVRFISLSCSTFQSKYLDDFKKVIDYVNRKNKLLICSSDNTNKISYPSYLDGVIGVQRCGASIDKYWFNKELDIQCICEANYRLLPSINKNYKLFGANSYCTAYFCGLLSNLIKNNNDIENKQFIEIISKNADKTIWTLNDMNLEKPLEVEISNKNYDYYKIKILVDLIEEFSKQKTQDIWTLPVYNLVGIDNVYEFLRYLESQTNKSITYNEVTHKHLKSIYSLYNLIFKDEKNEK